jgi:hypothetical protein
VKKNTIKGNGYNCKKKNIISRKKKEAIKGKWSVYSTGWIRKRKNGEKSKFSWVIGNYAGQTEQEEWWAEFGPKIIYTQSVVQFEILEELRIFQTNRCWNSQSYSCPKFHSILTKMQPMMMKIMFMSDFVFQEYLFVPREESILIMFSAIRNSKFKLNFYLEPSLVSKF